MEEECKQELAAERVRNERIAAELLELRKVNKRMHAELVQKTEESLESRLVIAKLSKENEKLLNDVRRLEQNS